MNTWKRVFDRDTTILGLVIACYNLVVGLAIIPSLGSLHQLTLFQELATVTTWGPAWVLVYATVGTWALVTTVHGFRRSQVWAFGSIIVLWAFVAAGWRDLTYIPPHGLASLLLNTSGSILVIKGKRGRT